MTELVMTARNAQLEEVMGLLAAQHDVKYDVVAPATHLRYEEGNLVVANGRTEWVEDEAFLTNAVLRPTALFDEGIADKLGIPIRYMRRLRDEAVELMDRNVNEWLSRAERNYLVRGFLTDEGEGLARAFLSDTFKVIDHIDLVFATLDGIREAGVKVVPTYADLSERKLRIKLKAPEIRARGEEFVRNYVSPSGERGKDNPYISAGLSISNSETGGGAFQIAPHATIEVCTNGMTVTREAMRKVHLGERLEEGVVAWSEETRAANLELVKSQAKDAVATFLSAEYLENLVSRMEERGRPMLSQPQAAVENISKAFSYTKEEQESILDHFIRGADTSVAGLTQAVTAYAQEVDDPDRAAELEEQAFDVLDHAYEMATR